MRIQSVNIGSPQSHKDGKDDSRTGIYKRPVDRAVTVTSEGLDGDAIADGRYHGGVDQALYLYGEPEYAFWTFSLGKPLLPGTFGENLTLTDFESAEFAVGDRFHIADVTLEATSPRIPCGTLARRMGDPQFVKKFRQAERPGIYCRVIRGGVVRAGDEVRHEPYAGEKITMLEIFRECFSPTKDAATVRRHLSVPLAIRVRQLKEERLAKLDPSSK